MLPQDLDRLCGLECAGYGEDGDVVVLAEGLGRMGNGFGGLSAERCAALKAEERAGFVAGLNYAVGEKSELLRGGQLEGRFGVDRVGGDAERETTLKLQFFAVDVRWNVARVGDGERAVSVGAEDEAGCEAAVAAGEHTLVHGGQDFSGALRVVRQGPHSAH